MDYRTFKGPSQNMHSQLLPPSEPRLLGSTHLGTVKGTSQNAYSQLLPPWEPRSLGSTHFHTFRVPKSQNVYSQLSPSEPALLGSAHFRTFKRPSQNVYCQLLPIRTQIAWEYALWDFQGAHAKMCTTSCSPHQSSHRL